VHRTRHLAATRTREGVPVVTLERAVVESWPLLVDDARRAPAIVAVRRRLTTPARLRQQVADHPRLPGRRALVELLGLLDLGCQSELELWGHQEVFTGPRSAHLRRQVPLLVAETGTLSLRFAHRRLTSDPEGCREQACRVMQVRRRQLGLAPPTGDTEPR
jgi:hypothetical protein